MQEALVTSITKKKEEEENGGGGVGGEEEDSIAMPLNLSPSNCLRIHIAVC